MARLAVAALALLFATPATAEPAPAPPLSESEQQAKLLQTAQEQLQATFKSFQFDEIKASDIPGIVEIYGGGRIFYYAPKQQLLLIGEMYTANGISLTEQKLSERAAANAASLDRSSAVVLGTGPRELIAFVDPDCGYCRATYRWLAGRDLGATRVLLYFTPLTGRPAAEAKALEVLCAKPEQRAGALKRAFDPTATDRPDMTVRCPEGVKALGQHAALAQKVGVYATPFFLAGGQVIAGFNKEKLDAHLAGLPPAPRAAQVANQ
jgi:thiol:disulfide interchange protein DsbC